MKKQIISLVLLFLLFMPSISMAKSVLDIEISLSDNINKDCWLGNSSNTISACYHNDDGIDKIFIRNDLPPQLLARTLMRSIGFFFLSDTTDEELNKLFLPPLVYHSIRDTAADGFVLWFYGVNMTPEQDQFFKELIRQ